MKKPVSLWIALMLSWLLAGPVLAQDGKESGAFVVRCEYSHLVARDGAKEDLMKWDGKNLWIWRDGRWSRGHGAYTYRVTEQNFERMGQQAISIHEHLTIDRTTGEVEEVFSSQGRPSMTMRRGVCRPAEEPKAMF
ncbi:hypothetical protein [Luteimonas arsenica]|uniref:hypothetical protein n=1 Tax=Luteimonas arsenica TaxID=1586242 RepID=UPI001056A6BE|nr:hypothetical protein [Luteimonas arsenica]